MKRYENDCCGCATEGYPCIHCGLEHNPHYYCDKCGDDVGDEELYKYEDMEICKDCLLDIIPKVSRD